MTTTPKLFTVVVMSNSVTDTGLIARLHHVSKDFGGVGGVERALNDVSLGLNRGEITAIVGPKGSGKSTLIRILAGVERPSTGEVWLGDTEMSSLEDGQLAAHRRKRIGLIFPEFNLLPNLDVMGNILLPFELDGRGPNPEESRWIMGLVTSLGLATKRTHRPHQLSATQQQRVAIARVLATRPHVIFADEPTKQLDRNNAGEVLGLLCAASSDCGQSVVLATTDPAVAARADRVFYLMDGEIVRDDSRSTAAEIAAVQQELALLRPVSA